MALSFKAGLITAAAMIGCVALPGMTAAADLYGRGSMKDGFTPMSHSAPAIAGPCYLRGDVGYAWNMDPSATYVGNAGGASPDVRGASIDAGMLYEAGIGCGSGSRGLRGEITIGVRKDREFKGDVGIFVFNPIDPPIKTKIDSYTVMANAFYDLGSYRGFVPYVGAGIGVALHDMQHVHIEHPLSPNPQFGETKADLAWSLMAGFGYQLSSRAILDVGYRYINMGSAHSDTEDVVLGGPNPRLVVDDMTAHEFKVGLRYHFGSSSDCCAYAPMK